MIGELALPPPPGFLPSLPALPVWGLACLVPLPSAQGGEVSNPGFYLASTIIMSGWNDLPLSPG